LQSGAVATITDTMNLTVQRGAVRLSAREREVLALVAAGISNKGIARELQVSPNTVKFHIAAILDKLDAATRAEAVVAALRRGELSL
jgi:two-component system nitrate/nitrite response regulator NarL